MTIDDLDCSIVILNWNQRELLRRSLAALREAASSPYHLEIIVVDNGSGDGSQRMVRTEFPEVRLLENANNQGIARGKNAGLRVAKGEFILLLDDDTIVSPAQLCGLLETARAHPTAAIVTGMKVDPAGQPLYTYHVPSPRTLGWAFFLVTEWSLVEIGRAIKRMLRWGEAIPHGTRALVEIPYIGGGIMLVRRRAIDEVGLFDANIFFYGEDFDWCYRFRQRGWTILYVPTIRVLSGYGVNAQRTKRSSLVALRSRRYLFEKYVGKRYLPVYMAIALAGLVPKLGYYAFRDLRGLPVHDISTWEWLRRAIDCVMKPRPQLAPGQGHAL